MLSKHESKDRRSVDNGARFKNGKDRPQPRMKIGLIADSHVPFGRERPPGYDGPFWSIELPPQVARAFAGVDLILHAGDIFAAKCLDELEHIAPVMAVEYPPSELFSDPRVVALRRVIELEGFSIGLAHELLIPDTGWEVMPGAIGARYPRERLLSSILAGVFGTPVDIVVFGDTHHAMVEEHHGMLFVNPGSPTLPKQLVKLGTVGILELTPAGREARILDLADF